MLAKEKAELSKLKSNTNNAMIEMIKIKKNPIFQYSVSPTKIN